MLARVLVHKSLTNSSGPMCCSCSCTWEREESAKGERGVHQHVRHGPTAPSHGGSTQPCSSCHRAQHHPEDVSPLPSSAQGLLLFMGRGCVLYRECLWRRYPETRLKTGSSMTWVGLGQEHGVWPEKGSWLCPSCCLTCAKSLTLNLWALFSLICEENNKYLYCGGGKV